MDIMGIQRNFFGKTFKNKKHRGEEFKFFRKTDGILSIFVMNQAYDSLQDSE